MTVKVPSYIAGPIREKIESVLGLMRDNVPEPIEELFVSTYPRANGPERYTLWIFTDQFVVKVDNPLNLDRIQHEMAYLANCVDWVQLDARNFDFRTHASDSQLMLQFTTADGLSAELWGEGEGCPHLLTIYKERFLKNFYPPEMNTTEWYRRE